MNERAAARDRLEVKAFNANFYLSQKMYKKFLKNQDTFFATLGRLYNFLSGQYLPVRIISLSGNSIPANCKMDSIMK